MAEKITKQEAVRRALQELGNDARPAQMKVWIKDRLGIDMTADHVSTAKGDILRKAGIKGKRKKPGRRPAARAAEPRPAAQAGPAPARDDQQARIALDDIAYLKALVGRHGPSPLHTLIDLLAQ
jgi:hypothetical protein